MIHLVNKGNLYEEKRAQIILNPVSVSKSQLGQGVFNNYLKHSKKHVYDQYRDYMVGESQNRLLGDIQLVKTDDNTFIMNGFMYKGNKIDLTALTKVLVELYNLAYEYKLDIAIPLKMNCRNDIIINYIKIIIDVVFSDFENNVYLYTKSSNYKK